MQLQIDLNGNENAVSLDRIIDMVLDNAEAEQQPQFDYMRFYEQKFMEEIKKYSRMTTWRKLKHLQSIRFWNMPDWRDEGYSGGHHQAANIIRKPWQVRSCQGFCLCKV